jgi:hypothetical protein
MMGFLKASSALAIVAAAVSIASVPANAADYGGDCCADLEERVAELEATAVKHGNRKVSLTISGSVTEALIYWNDGYESDVNVIVPDAYGAGLSLRGEGNVTSDVSVGYVIALDVRHGDPGDIGGKDNLLDGSLQSYQATGKIAVDQQYVYLNSKSAGRLSMGKRNDAYASARNFDGSIVDMAAGLNLVNGGVVVPANTNPRLGIGWGKVLGGLGDTSGMMIRYDSPSLAGFTFGASWGNDDTGTANIGWTGSFSGTNLSVAVGYSDDTSGKPTGSPEREVSYNASISNDPTGLFLQGAYEDDLDVDDRYAWQIKGGWGQNVNGLGKTTLYGIYQVSSDLALGTTIAATANSASKGLAITDSMATGLGLVATQDIDAVGATLFVRYDHRSVNDLTVVGGIDVDVEDLSTVTTGMTVRF